MKNCKNFDCSLAKRKSTHNLLAKSLTPSKELNTIKFFHNEKQTTQNETLNKQDSNDYWRTTLLQLHQKYKLSSERRECQCNETLSSINKQRELIDKQIGSTKCYTKFDGNKTERVSIKGGLKTLRKSEENFRWPSENLVQKDSKQKGVVQGFSINNKKSNIEQLPTKSFRNSILENTPDKKKCKAVKPKVSKIERQNSAQLSIHRRTQSTNEPIVKRQGNVSFTKLHAKQKETRRLSEKVQKIKARPVVSIGESVKKLNSPKKIHSSKNVPAMSKIIEERRCSGKRINTLSRSIKSNSTTLRDKHNFKFQKLTLKCDTKKSESVSTRAIYKKIISPANKKPTSLKESITKFNPTKRVKSERSKNKSKTLKDSEEISNHIMSYIKMHNKIPATNMDFYKIGRVLGRGAFGKVNLGMHKLTGKLVAIKSIKKAHLTNKISRDKVMKEFSILKALRHQNIIRLYESFETDKHILIVMELCAGGDSLNYIKRHRRVKEEVAKSILKGLITGLGYCHSRGILHRDIKLENILFNNVGELKICDFGVSRSITRGEKIMERCGTPAYIAPEIVKGEGYQDFAADVWSAGVVLYSMLHGTLPFKASNINDLNRLILRGKYKVKEEFSDEAKDLLKRMLKRNPNKRITIPEILNHKWLHNTSKRTHIFTESEVICLNKEYWDGYKSDSNNETFNEVDISSTQSDIERNSSVKSIILGPFNSNEGENAEIQIEEDMIYSKDSIIKFSAKVRDTDRQYEHNNNGDVDNGVYNKFLINSNEDDLDKKEYFNSESISEDSIDTAKRFYKVKVPTFINKPIKIGIS